MKKTPLKKNCDVEKLEVGVRYLVRSLKVLCPIAGYGPGEYVPIIGDEHADPELGTTYQHFHYDFRFIHPRKMNDVSLHLVINLHKYGRDDQEMMVVKQPEWKPQQCYRLSVNPPLVLSDRAEECWQQFEQSYTNTRLSDCRTCPHRGFDLRHTPPNEKGEIVCPGHFLRWNSQSGQLSRHWMKFRKS